MNPADCGRSEPAPFADGSGWRRAYREAPQVLHEFACAEDPDELVRTALAEWMPTGSRSVLELGCGTICFGATLTSNWIGLDSALAVIAQASTANTRRLICARAEQIPLSDRSVEVVLATWMLGYLRPQSLRQCLSECDRVLRPGGGVLAVENGDHPHGMPADGMIHRLLNAGFQEIAEIDTELRFADAARAREVTRFLMGDLAPTPTAQGCIPHRVKLLRREIP